MCTLRMLDVVKERPQSGNGHVNGLSPGKKKTDKRQVRGNKSLFEIKKYGQELSRKVAIPLNAILVHLKYFPVSCQDALTFRQLFLDEEEHCDNRNL